MKTIPFIIFLALSLVASAQSKKEQIKQLNKDLDSMKLAFDIQRAKFAQNETIIQSQNSRFELLGIENSRMDNQIRSLNQDLNAKTNQIKNIQKDLSTKTDSIRLFKQMLLEKANNKNEAQPFEITYATLNKPAKDSMENIHDWLEQFTLLEEGKTTFYDEKTALFYGGGEIQFSSHGIVNIEHAIYKEGIIFSKRYEHEGALYQLFIPMLSEKDIKKNIERLCKNMGGCVPVEEMVIEYEQTEFGIRISWGGGC
jgi:chromosome segregation ATPase